MSQEDAGHRPDALTKALTGATGSVVQRDDLQAWAAAARPVGRPRRSARKAVSVNLMMCSSPFSRALSPAASADSADLATGPGQVWAGLNRAVIAAHTCQSAVWVGSHKCLGKTSRTSIAALGAVAAWTSRIAEP